MNQDDFLKQKEAQLRKQLETIEFLKTHQDAFDALGLELTSKTQDTQANTASIPTKQLQRSTQKKQGKKAKRTQGLKAAGIDVFRLLPKRYTREDIVRLLNEKHPVIAATMSPNSIRAILKVFVDEGWAKLVVESKGTNPSVYEKIEGNNGLKFE